MATRTAALMNREEQVSTIAEQKELWWRKT